MIGNGKSIIDYIIDTGLDKNYEIKKYTKRKTITQNSYSWVLITNIADKISKSKEEVYLDLLKNYGQSTIISLRDDIDPSKWFKYYEVIGSGQVNNNKFNHIKVYKGTSEYSIDEMIVFIDGVLQECRELNIPTLTKKEIESLKL